MAEPHLASAGRRAARAALGGLFAITLLNYLDRALVSILQIPIKAELKLSDSQLGLLTGLTFSLFYAVGAIPMARLVDRLERRRLLAGAIALWSLMTAAAGLATSFGMLLLCRIGVAFGESVCTPASHSLIADHFPRAKRGTAIAVWALANPVGAMLGIGAGGLLGHALGWRWAFLLIGGIGLFGAPFVLLLKEPARGQFDPKPANAVIPFKDALALLWRRRSFRYLVLAATLSAYAHANILNWTAPFYSRVHHLDLRQTALWVGLLIGVAGGIGAFSGGVLADLLGRRQRRWYGLLPCFATLAVIPLALLQYFLPDVRLSLAFGFLTTLSAVLFLSPVNAAAQSMVPSTMRGTTAAVLLIVPMIVGTGIGPVVTGVISDTLAHRYGLGAESLRLALASWTLLLIPSAIAYWLASRHLEQDIPQDGLAVAGPGLAPELRTPTTPVPGPLSAAEIL
jgi:predicted MFS family arabinose efflux permease